MVVEDEARNNRILQCPQEKGISCSQEQTRLLLAQAFSGETALPPALEILTNMKILILAILAVDSSDVSLMAKKGLERFGHEVAVISPDDWPRLQALFGDPFPRGAGP